MTVAESVNETLESVYAKNATTIEAWLGMFGDWLVEWEPGKLQRPVTKVDVRSKKLYARAESVAVIPAGRGSCPTITYMCCGKKYLLRQAKRKLILIPLGYEFLPSMQERCSESYVKKHLVLERQLILDVSIEFEERVLFLRRERAAWHGFALCEQFEDELGVCDTFRILRVVEPDTNGVPVVYLVRNGGLYKIGITRNLCKRMKQLKPDELLSVSPQKNPVEMERELHTKYKSCRVPQTEYFRLNQDQLNEILLIMGEDFGPIVKTVSL